MLSNGLILPTPRNPHLSPARGQAIGQPGLGHTAKSLESQQGEWWAGGGGFGRPLGSPYLARSIGHSEHWGGGYFVAMPTQAESHPMEA